MRRALVLLFFIATAARAAELPREPWARLRVDELTIYSNAGDRVTRGLAEDILRMRDALAHVTKLNVRSPLPLNVFVFRNEKSFAPWRDLLMGENIRHVAGLFSDTPEANFIIFNGDGDGGIDRVVYHELTHAFTSSTAADLPLWVSEGLAEFYSTFDMAAGTVKVGLAPRSNLDWLDERALMPFDTLFQVRSESRDYRDETRGADFYASSWALVHYLLIGAPQRAGQLGTYLALLDAKKPREVAFAQAFGTTVGELENEVRRYLRRPTMSYLRYTIAELKPRPIPRLEEAPRDEVLWALADLFVRSERGVRDVEPLLRESLELNPERAEAHTTLGLLLEKSGEYAAADAEYERGAQLGSSDFRTYSTYGASLMRRATFGASPPAIRKLRQLYLKASELNPNVAAIWGNLGSTYAMLGDESAAGIDALKRALALSPSQEHAAVNLVLLHARNGDRTAAEQVIAAYLVPRGNADAIRRARENLVFADIARAEALSREGKDEEAVALLISARDAVSDPELRRRISDAVDGLQKELTEQKQIAELNRAVQLARDGKLHDALAIVETVLPGVKDEEILGQAREFHGRLVARMRKKK